jgi:hypothetical protein
MRRVWRLVRPHPTFKVRAGQNPHAIDEGYRTPRLMTTNNHPWMFNEVTARNIGRGT